MRVVYGRLLKPDIAAVILSLIKTPSSTTKHPQPMTQGHKHIAQIWCCVYACDELFTIVIATTYVASENIFIWESVGHGALRLSAYLQLRDTVTDLLTVAECRWTGSY